MLIKPVLRLTTLLSEISNQYTRELHLAQMIQLHGPTAFAAIGESI